MNRHADGAGHREWTEGARAFVVFSGSADLPWLRLLRPGFRHCYAVVESRGLWAAYNPASHQTDLSVIGELPFSMLAAWLFDGEKTVVGCRVSRAEHRLAPVRPYTCVEAIKRLLGLRAPLVFTPWQLFRHLTRHENQKNKKINLTI